MSRFKKYYISIGMYRKFSIILDFEMVPWAYMHGYPM